MLDKLSFAGPIPRIHDAELGWNHMRFIHQKQKGMTIHPQIIQQRIGSFSSLVLCKVTAVVLEAPAKGRLAQQKAIVQTLRFVSLALAYELFGVFSGFLSNGDAAGFFQAVFGYNVVSGRK